MCEQNKPRGTPAVFVKLHVLGRNFQSLIENSCGELYTSGSRISGMVQSRKCLRVLGEKKYTNIKAG